MAWQDDSESLKNIIIGQQDTEIYRELVLRLDVAHFD